MSSLCFSPSGSRQSAGRDELGRHGRRTPGLAAGESLPHCYPRLENQRILQKSARRPWVRDRGVGGSNPLAPTTQFIGESAMFGLTGRSVPFERHAGTE
jgi:hypothetical protein